jgi:CRISP-associated protein Cas1
MAWKTVIIESSARLKLRNKQLVIDKADIEHTVPLEDIDTLILGCATINLTLPVLQGIAEAGGAVLVCDGKHLPCGIYLGMHQHYKAGAAVELQLNASVPLKKRLWQRIVQAKIANQAWLLDRLERVGAGRLLSLVDKVRSGDTSNIEALAAKTYWGSLFGAPFRRGADVDCNWALNY